MFYLLATLPGLLLGGTLLIYPLIFLLTTSFHNTNLFNLANPRFVGIANYKDLFTDPIFLKALTNTALFTIISVGLQLALGIGLAVLVHKMRLRTKGLITLLLLLPFMVSEVAVSLTWKQLLDYGTGLINYTLILIHLPPQAWLGEPKLAFAMIILVSLWQWTPFSFLLSLAGLESLPKEPFDAARVDGASPTQMFFYITLPLLRPVILVILFFRLTSSIRLFDKVYVLTGGGPGTATETISTYIYRVGLSRLELGKAAAGGVVMLIIAVVIGFIFVNRMFKEGR